jgi:drug/metabolite transporter (DMT)-like permease
VTGAILLIPLTSAFLYALAAIFLKRALAEGAGRWRVTFGCNMVMAVGYQVCWLARTQPFSGIGMAHATLAACAFFAGQVFTFLALNRGDVSVVTPILGTKVIWVAVFSMLLVGRGHSAHVWAAVIMTAVGAAILGYQRGVHPRRVALSVGAALATSCSFGLTDVLVQKYAPEWGFGSFVPVMFLMVGVFSLGFMPLLRDGSGWAPGWLGPGAVLLAVQALGLAYALSTWGEATRINIAYNSRGLWSVVLIWVFGHWFGNTERDGGTRRMLQRMAGAGLLVGAILVASL